MSYEMEKEAVWADDQEKRRTKGQKEGKKRRKMLP